MKRFLEYMKTRLRIQHVVQETPASFLKDCQTKVCIERKPLRYSKIWILRVGWGGEVCLNGPVKLFPGLKSLGLVMVFNYNLAE